MKAAFTIGHRILIGLLISFLFIQESGAQYVYIPDANFRMKLIQLAPMAMNGDSLDTTSVQLLAIDTLSLNMSNINDLTGVQYLDNLSQLYCNNNYVGTLPPLPATLKDIDCSYCGLTTLPALPNGLKILYCYNNSITALPTLPDSLEILACSVNQFSTLPPLPAGLIHLSCGTLSMSSLPVLPGNLQTLYIAHNSFSSLPALPNTITRLNVEYNNLSALPTLPDSLIYLECEYNQLTALPPYPAPLCSLYCYNNLLTALPSFTPNVVFLDCSYNQLTSLPPFQTNYFYTLQAGHNQLTSLPPLPGYMWYLRIENNPISHLPPFPTLRLLDLNVGGTNLTDLSPLPDQLLYLTVDSTAISCLPLLPSHLQYLSGRGAAYTCLPNHPASLTTINGDTTLCTQGTSGCVIYPRITGTAFNDDNLNGVFDASEIGHPNVNISIQPGDYFVSSDMAGEFLGIVDTGMAYTITPEPLLYYNISPSTNSTPVLSALMNDTASDFILQRTGVVHDLRVDLTFYCPARAGSLNDQLLHLVNVGTVKDTTTLKFTYDAQTTLVSSIPPADSTNGNTLFWKNIVLVPGQSFDSRIRTSVSTSTPIGTQLIFHGEALSNWTDATPLDNADTVSVITVGAVDPNDKTVEPAGEVIPAQIASGQWLDYTIRFQNTGNAEAYFIEIIDTLSDNLDLSSLQIVSSSHSMKWSVSHRVADFRFENIMLPDSNADEAGSHGFVRYRIKMKTTLVVGDEVNNTAYIFFDYNAPVVTNTTNTTVAINAGVSSINQANDFTIYPNPTSGEFRIHSRNGLIKNCKIKLVNTLGELIFEKQFSDFSDEKISLNELGLAKGVYLLVIGTEKVRVIYK